MRKLIAERLGGTRFGQGDSSYKFARIKAAKARAIAANPDKELLDFGVGEPDRPAGAEMAAILGREAAKPENRHYADNGIPAFQDAAARWLHRTFGVEIANPTRDLVHCIGSKSALAMLPAAFINPGDVCLSTVPGYPIAATWTSYLGGENYALPLLRQNDYLPDLDAIPTEIRRRAKLLYLNYPNNPTGRPASAAFFDHAIEFARREKLIIIHDAAYAALCWDDQAPLSFLSRPGAAEVGVEVHSLSKTFDMTGWRLGFVCGNPLAVQAFAAIKDNSDSGQFRAIQQAAVYALDHGQAEIDARRARYAHRLGILAAALQDNGFAAEKPSSSFYIYVPAPVSATNPATGKREIFPDAESAATFLLEHALVSVIPWDDAGPHLRFSATFGIPDNEFESAAEQSVIAQLDARLRQLKLAFS